MVVIRGTPGLYRLAELDGTGSKLRFAAFCLVPCHTRSCASVLVTRLVESPIFIWMKTRRFQHPTLATEPIATIRMHMFGAALTHVPVYVLADTSTQ